MTVKAPCHVLSNKVWATYISLWHNRGSKLGSTPLSPRWAIWCLSDPPAGRTNSLAPSIMPSSTQTKLHSLLFIWPWSEWSLGWRTLEMSPCLLAQSVFLALTSNEWTWTVANLRNILYLPISLKPLYSIYEFSHTTPVGETAVRVPQKMAAYAIMPTMTNN